MLSPIEVDVAHLRSATITRYGIAVRLSREQQAECLPPAVATAWTATSVHEPSLPVLSERPGPHLTLSRAGRRVVLAHEAP
ncbi:hypothetical protein ACRRNA_12745 [Streptomyces sp. DW26H14]